MNVLALEDGEKTAIRAKLESAIETAKDACKGLQERTAAAAKATDKVIRGHPYQAVGIALGLGVLIGALAVWRKRS